MKGKGQADKAIAEESEKTKKARQKLKKRLMELERKVTVQALERKNMEIHRWIARHAPQRIVLRSKNISLFDENKNTAEISARISKVALQLSTDFGFSK
jgi:hypothetical protein